MKFKHRSCHSSVVPTMACVFAMSGSSFASLWTGSSDSNWNNLSNWDSNPSGGNGEVDTLTNVPVITGNNTLVPNDLKIGTAPNTTGRVDIRSGTFTINYWTFVGDWNGSGTLNIADTSTNGGTFTGFGTGTASYDADNNGNANFMVGLYQSTGVVNMNTSGSLFASDIRLNPNGQGGSGTFNLDNGNVNLAGNFEAGSDFWGANVTGSGILNMSGGAITTGNEFWTGASGIGTGTMTGGTINSGAWFVVGRTSGSNGTFNMNAGTVNAATINAGAFTSIGSFGGSQGTLNLSGTADFNSTQIYVAEGGTGTLTVAGSADVDMSGGMQVGLYNGSSGTFSQTGGTVNMNGGGLVLGRFAGATGNATLSAGTMTAAEDSVIGYEGNGTLTVSGTGTFVSPANKWVLVGIVGGVSSTINLNSGGTFEARHVERDGIGAATFNFDGGTFRVNSVDDTMFDNYNENNITVRIRNGGAIIHTNGFDKTVGTDLLEDGGSTGGGLTKLGAGTLTLDGNNTYTGNTIVNDGTLAVPETGSLRFRPNTNGSTNAVFGPGVLSFLGTISLDLGAVNTAVGNVWNLIDLASFTSSTVNAVAVTSTTLGAFTETSPGFWQLSTPGADWTFSEANGNLSLVPTGNLTVGAPHGTFNRLSVTLAPDLLASSSDTSDLTGTMNVVMDIDPATGKTPVLSITGGRLSGTDMSFVRTNIFPFLAYNIQATGLAGTVSTMFPPGVVNPDTGVFSADQHRFSIDQGSFTGTAAGNPVNITLSPTAPFSGLGAGNGMLTLTAAGTSGSYKLFNTVVTLPVAVNEIRSISGVNVNITATGTIQATGQVQIPASEFIAWMIQQGATSFDPNTDTAGNGAPDAIKWALGLGLHDNPLTFLLRPSPSTPGTFTIALPPGGTAAPLTVESSSTLLPNSWVPLPAGLMTSGVNPIPAASTGTIQITPTSPGPFFMRLRSNP